ncbi:hypothetical protein JX266_012890 [Neoarthrinium moseri]|nr:hypothetical protein JX266_012890 [Neoarthrinium moseri]
MVLDVDSRPSGLGSYTKWRPHFEQRLDTITAAQPQSYGLLPPSPPSSTAKRSKPQIKGTGVENALHGHLSKTFDIVSGHNSTPTVHEGLLYTAPTVVSRPDGNMSTSSSVFQEDRAEVCTSQSHPSHQPSLLDTVIATTPQGLYSTIQSVEPHRNSLLQKRVRASHDVDGPHTGHLPCKKRRLRLQLITSRLSLPFSLPATHILNRESDEDTPVISRFVKYAALAAKRAGHQTALVRKAAIMNRVRLTARKAAINRGLERLWKMTGMGSMSHGFQLVTDSTGAMFPGRSGEQVPGPIVPRAWRPHTTTTIVDNSTGSTMTQFSEVHDSNVSRLDPVQHPTIAEHAPMATSIMTPLAGADEDEASFPTSDLDRYAEISDEELDDVYADFGVLFGGGAGSPETSEDDGHFYEEYLDEVDGIIWAS